LKFFISLVDQTKNWIEDIDQKELKLFVADSEWNILDTQPENLLCETNSRKCPVRKLYNPVIFEKGYEWFRIEKIICNGKEYAIISEIPKIGDIL